MTKGKITQFARKAIIGGYIKANIVDKNGNNINQNTSFKPETIISIEAIKEDLSVYIPQFISNEGNRLSSNLFPGKYKVDLTIRWNAYGYGYFLTDILVKSKETTEITFVVDLNDPELKNILLNK